MRTFIGICLSFFFVACSSNPVPKDILTRGKMENVVHDLLKVDEYLNNFVSRDTSVNIKKQRSIFYAEVFKLHGTDRKQFYTSYRYYQQHPDMQKALFDSVLAKAHRQSMESSHISPIMNGKQKLNKLK